jgi:hypothetical protein
MKTSNYQKALAIHRLEERDGIKKLTMSFGIKDACDRYIQDAQARDLKGPTLYKFRLLFRQLQEFAADKGLVFISDLNLDNMRQFRATWPNENELARVKLGNFRAFIRFCHKAKWIEENYTEDLKAAKVADQKIVPLEPDEIMKILKACDRALAEGPGHRAESHDPGDAVHRPAYSRRGHVAARFHPRQSAVPPDSQDRRHQDD